MSAGGGGGDGEVELNITPIIDCFTVLIAYLLVSMSFISLSIIDAGVAATAPPSDTPPPETVPPPDPPLTFAISVQEGNKLELKLTGGKENLNLVTPIEALADGPDVNTLKTKVEEIHQLHPDLKEANISADAAIKYKTIMKVISTVKAQLAKVFLAS